MNSRTRGEVSFSSFERERERKKNPRDSGLLDAKHFVLRATKCPCDKKKYDERAHLCNPITTCAAKINVVIKKASHFYARTRIFLLPPVRIPRVIVYICIVMVDERRLRLLCPCYGCLYLMTSDVREIVCQKLSPYTWK